MIGCSFLASLAFEGAGAALARALPLVGAREGGAAVIETVPMRARSTDSRARILSPRETSEDWMPIRTSVRSGDGERDISKVRWGRVKDVGLREQV